jgi:hypothetical protein
MTVVAQTSRFSGKLFTDHGDEGIIIGNYDNLVACAKDDYQNVFILGTQIIGSTADGVIIRRDHAQRGLYEEVFRFRGTEYGKCGGGSLVCINGFLVVSLSVRQANGDQDVREYIVQNCGVNV